MDSIEKDQPKTSNAEATKDTDATKKEAEEPSFTIDSEETPSFFSNMRDGNIMTGTNARSIICIVITVIIDLIAAIFLGHMGGSIFMTLFIVFIPLINLVVLITVNYKLLKYAVSNSSNKQQLGAIAVIAVLIATIAGAAIGVYINTIQNNGKYQTCGDACSNDEVSINTILLPIILAQTHLIGAYKGAYDATKEKEPGNMPPKTP